MTQTEQKAIYKALIEGNHSLGGEHWKGWRLAGRDLVSPCGYRINPRRLLGMIWSDDTKRRKAKAVLRGQGRVIELKGARAALDKAR